MAEIQNRKKKGIAMTVQKKQCPVFGMRNLMAMVFPFFLMGGCCGQQCAKPDSNDKNAKTVAANEVLKLDTILADQAHWQELLTQRIPALGQHNWIVIADTAFPVHSVQGIETIVTESDPLDLLKAVFSGLEQTRHVNANIYTDTELKYMEDRDARGIDDYRTRLANVLTDKAVVASISSISHDEMMARIDKSAEKYSVIVFKSNLRVPYTSIFIELGTGYWNADMERRLRQRMAGEK
jgi:L-fucose mutarotase/ribose pyranase (RbsD/FucU family)